jgi:hypothetical protein
MPKGKYKRKTETGLEKSLFADQTPEEYIEKIEARVSKATVPARTEQRICFGIMWFTSQKDAAIAHDTVRRQGRTVNGGFFDGMACGRAPEWDYEEDGIKYFAVTN